MHPVFSFGAVLAAGLVRLAIANDNPIVDSQSLRDLIDEAELVTKAASIQGLAYATPDRNRLVGTPGLKYSMQYIWDALAELDYYHLFPHCFDFETEENSEMTRTCQIIAQTKEGDPDNVLHLGAHMDSVAEGPGINDNASGGIGILEVAIQLAKFSVNNAVRFSWWTAEEQGLIGSRKYVELLTKEEQEKIRLYLNFDMIASPVADIGVYGTDFSGAGYTAVPGAKEAEKLFQDYFDDVAHLDWQTRTLGPSSDHWPFVQVDIPICGLHAGDDPNYHTADDTVENMNPKLFVDMTKAIAHAVGTYAASFDSLPPRRIATGGEWDL
ncbi:hypothetical protein diail_1922 [Diaporthe ilicicola]|nr:hypothetical protein diail_1922 [Diaporthe ilicicola]